MKKFKREYRILALFLALFVLLGVGFLFVSIFAQNNQMKLLQLSEVLENKTYRSNDFFIDMSVSKSWTEDNGEVGSQYDGVFYNNSNNDVTNWQVEIEIPESGRIDSSWNGVYEKKGTALKITPVDYNTIIDKNSNDTFGFVMYTPPEYQVSHITVRYYKVYRARDFFVYWVLVAALCCLALSALVYAIIEYRVRKYKLKQQQDQKFIMQSLNTFANFIDVKDPYTKGHSVRVAVYAREIAKRMGMKEDEQSTISYIGLLHDAGKVGIGDDILQKPGKLTQEEWKTIQMHTMIGADILKDFTALPGILDGAKYHHERFDGSGYPNGLRGKDIPLCARIICIADSYDAMASDRCYRKRFDEQRILLELTTCAGTQFDPDIAEYMIEMIRDGFVNQIRQSA